MLSERSQTTVYTHQITESLLVTISYEPIYEDSPEWSYNDITHFPGEYRLILHTIPVNTHKYYTQYKRFVHTFSPVKV